LRGERSKRDSARTHRERLEEGQRGKKRKSAEAGMAIWWRVRGGGWGKQVCTALPVFWCREGGKEGREAQAMTVVVKEKILE